MQNKNNNYTLGLDLGTSSVGWAVLKNNYELIKKGNNHMWGYDIFPEGQTAKERRQHRGTRRLYVRKRQRIHLLQDLLGEMIYPIDSLFFKRLNLSYKAIEERPDFYEEGSQLLIGDYKDKDFYKEYPTIYHLRKALITSSEKFDPRLIYLAVHHIVKYRGNFLYEGQNFNLDDSENLFNNIADALNYILCDEDECVDIKEIQDILLNTKLYKKQKNELIKKLVLSKDLQKKLDSFAKAVLGYKFDPNLLFEIELEKTISFKDTDIEEKATDLEAKMGDNYYVFEALNSIYSFLVLKNILSFSDSDKLPTISKSMVEIYKKHHNDLQLLKSILVGNAREEVLAKNGLYDKYINTPSKMSKDDFYSKLNKVLSTLPESEKKANIQNKIENKEFLLRQNSTDNNAIPYQLHLKELEMILDNQSKYYPCLSRQRDKIISLVIFRIPYYVGPLDKNATNAWIKRSDNSKEPIRPWNWKELVDIDATAKEFINRMKNHCTYILAEDTLPKNSILLNRFNVLNELNKIRFEDDGKYVASSKEIKEQIIKDLFLNKDEVKASDLKQWLFDNQFRTNINFDLKGFQAENKFSSSLKSERKIRRIFGDEFDNNLEDIETIIEYLTVYNEQGIIKRKLESDFNLNKEQIKKLARLNYSGYGRFSAKLIDGLVSRSTGNSRVGTILNLMYETNDNFMQILNDQNYGFIDIINDLNEEKKTGKLSYEDVDELPISPALKRGVWQTIKVTQDIVKCMGSNPTNIYLEFAREEGKKTRTNTRFKNLMQIFKDDDTYKYLVDELNDNKDKLANERVYLYFIQQGKCMYTGEKLELDRLQTYQIDHILPQSYTVDDSIENKALVISAANQRKKDNLLLFKEVISSQKARWKHLLDVGLIGRKKYDNLTRTSVSKNEQIKFVARQLVETRQICVHVKNLLKTYYPNTNIAVVHAPLSSEFRQKNSLYKIREINNCHHAQDAYLAAMIGQFIDKRYPSIYGYGRIDYSEIEETIKERLKEEDIEKYGKERLLYNFVVNQMNKTVLYDKNGEVYWNGEEENSYIRKVFTSKDYYYNYLTRDNDGMLYNATLYPRGDKGAKVAAKNNRKVELYGGYDSIKPAYGAAIEYQKGKKLTRTVVNIPIIYSKRPDEYLEQSLGTKTFKLLKKLPLGQLFKIDGCIYSMQSASEWQIRQPIFLDNDVLKVLDDIKKKKGRNSTPEEKYNTLICIVEKMKRHMPSLNEQLNKFISLDGETKQRYLTMSSDEQKELLEQLMLTISKNGSSKVTFENKSIERFGRLSGKALNLNDTEFIYTSPSGIYKKIVKL